MGDRENQSVVTKRYASQTVTIMGIVIMIIFTTIVVNTVLLMKKTDQYELVQGSNDFWEASQYLTTEARYYVITGEIEHSDNYYTEVNIDKRREHTKETMFGIGLKDDEKALIEKVESISNRLVPLEEQAMEMVEAKDLQGAQAILYGEEYCESIEEIKDTISEFMGKIETRTERQTNILRFL